MGEFVVFQVGVSLVGDLMWQSSLFLLAGLASAFVLSRRPARAHRILLLAIVGAMITPLCGQLVRTEGWGLWMTNPSGHTSGFASFANSKAPRAESSAVIAQEHTRAASGEAIRSAEALPAAVSAATSGVRENNGTERRATAPVAGLDWLNFSALGRIGIRRAFEGLWLVGSGLFLARLVVSVVRGRRLASRARPIRCESIESAARVALARLGLHVRPELHVSSDVDCPAIWCWSRSPLIVLPETAESTARVDWSGVFCHELAHWVRRDHWSGLIAELLVVALPWHPLAWMAKHRLGQQSELACDDWVLSVGVPATDYAESLLRLVPGRSTPLALAAVSSRAGLIDRIRHILRERRSSPVVGARWSCGSTAAVLLAASTLALAQSRPVLSSNPGAKRADNPATASKEIDLSTQNSRKTGTIRGTVLGPNGKPAPSVTVFWIGNRKLPVTGSAMPRSIGNGRLCKAELIARADSDANGQFTLDADFDAGHYIRYNGWDVGLLVRATGAGMLYVPVKAETGEVSLRLPAEALVHGRLLAPNGMPAADVRVTLTEFGDYQDEPAWHGISLGLMQTDDEIPAFWPPALKTDQGGRFTLEGLPREACAKLVFWHPDYAVDEVTVNTRTDQKVPESLRSFEIVPVLPDFSHTVEPARPIQGRVTDEMSNRPLSSVLVQVIPMRRHGGMPFQTLTDSDGRYRVSGHQADQFYIEVYPPAESGYLSQQDRKDGWPAGAKFIERNFALQKGRIVHGLVIDGGSKQPIAGAAVVYQAKRGNPNNTSSNAFRNTVLTDDGGRFAITSLPGEGFLAVETADENYVRVMFSEGFRTVYPQGLTAINVPKEREPKPATIETRKGVTLEARAIGPDGKVVREITAFCKGIDAKLIDVWNKAQPFEDGVFRLKGADPNKTYRVFFLQYKHRLGAVAELKFNPGSAPTEVRLQPTARVHGEFVKTGGSPVMGGQVLPYLLLDQAQTELRPNDVSDRDTALINVSLFPNEGWTGFYEKCRLEGKFQFEHLIAGARYGMSVNSGTVVDIASVPPLEPGEDRDLGTITLKGRPQ